MKRLVITLSVLFAAYFTLFAQEALKSAEEEYYDFLAITGKAERPTLGYRTLSDSQWKVTDDEHTWSGNNLGTRWTVREDNNEKANWFTRGLNRNVVAKIYGPEWYNSYNTAFPYGQNDGALWQGKGYNTSLTGGARLEAYGFELTIKPTLNWSQNKEFDLVDNSAYYTSPYAYIWGYGRDIGADAPQRFGDHSFWTFDWGDTELRWTWHTFTIGIGTQSPWVGPAWLNPILHSNNAATYPKVDAGLRKTEIHMPHFGWDLGAIEGRIWTGYLSESDYFDDDSSNDHTMFHGLSLSYAPSFIPGLTLTANRVCLVKWELGNLKYVLPKNENTYIGATNGNGEDQKVSVSADWVFPSVGFEAYGELGFDDGFDANYALHAQIYTVGLKKTIPISRKHRITGEIVTEWNFFEMSEDFHTSWNYNYGFHYQIMHGYTNKGQWIGSGIGYGSTSRFIGFNIYFPKGNLFLFFQRGNYDTDYVWVLLNSGVTDTETSTYSGYKNFGISGTYYVVRNLRLSAGILSESIGNPGYHKKTWERNISAQFGISYEF